MRISSTLDDKFRPFVSLKKLFEKGWEWEKLMGRMKEDEHDKQEDTSEATIYIKDTQPDQSLSLLFADR